ncbi:MAG: hypothetical protein ACJAT2_001203 [Bacteriovoracaceae bacterium]|jgi:hypothetical protein
MLKHLQNNKRQNDICYKKEALLNNKAFFLILKVPGHLHL